MRAEVAGKRKREIGLVVPVKYIATTDDFKFAEVLLKNLNEKTKIVDINVQTTYLRNILVSLKRKMNEKYNEFVCV